MSWAQKQNLMSNYEFINTSPNPDSESPEGRKQYPDVVAYSKQIYQSKIQPSGAVTSYSYADLVFEMKDEDGNDPFDSRDLYYFEATPQEMKESRGQTVGYQNQVMGRQPRNHSFSGYITRKHCRLIYWDRAGMVVSRS